MAKYGIKICEKDWLDGEHVSFEDNQVDRWGGIQFSECENKKQIKYEIKYKKNAIEFYSSGLPTITRKAQWVKEIDHLDISKFQYLVIQYKAVGIYKGKYEPTLQPIISFSGHEVNKNDEICEKIVDDGEIIFDGLWHTAVIPMNIKMFLNKLILSYNSQDSEASFAISLLEFIEFYEELPLCIDDLCSTTETKEFKCLDLNQLFNAKYDDIFINMLNGSKIENKYNSVDTVSKSNDEKSNVIITDCGKYFEFEDNIVSGIPFKVKPQGENVITPPSGPKENEEFITNYGLNAKRRLVAPMSRDSLIEVEISEKATEIFFLMMAEIPNRRKGYPGFIIKDVEEFVVEIVYANGRKDFVFPYSIYAKKHIMKGVFGAYVVPASGGVIEKVIFHNRMLDNQINISAISLNQGEKRYYPEITGRYNKKSKTINLVDNIDNDCLPYLNYRNEKIEIGNKYIDMKMNISNGFSITSICNKFIKDYDVILSNSSSMKINIDGEEIEKFKLLDVTQNVEANKKNMLLTYKASEIELPLIFEIFIEVENECNICMRLRIQNQGDAEMNVGVTFPIINDLVIGDVQDMWYLFPQMKTHLSNENGYLYAPFSYRFPVQFYDVFNPKIGGGIYVSTRELEHIARDYSLSKNDTGVSCFIKYPKQYTHIKPKHNFNFSDTRIGVHKGDWHDAADAYKNWFEATSKKINRKNKKWFRESFLLLSDCVDSVGDNSLFESPTWYDKNKQTFIMKKFVEEYVHKKGRKPDILHWWCWTFRENLEYPNNFIFGDSENFERFGGIEAFRFENLKFQKETGIQISLYNNPKLCDKTLPIAKRIGTNQCMTSFDGRIRIPLHHTYQFCPMVEEWASHQANVYKKLNQETGINMLYVDQFATGTENCYSHEHGHEVPLNMNKGDERMYKAIRSAVHEDVVLYGEFPNVDINTNYLDCTLTYYLQSDFSWRCRIYNQKSIDSGSQEPFFNILRFLFPDVVQMPIIIGLQHESWHKLKFTFFNGESIYDYLWVAFESKAEAFMTKAFNIKKTYADCFSTENPKMLVATELEEVYSNMFPGEGRTIWTIYNGRYTTIRENVITIEHIEGAKYYDVWNNKPLDAKLLSGKAYISLELYPQSIGCFMQFV